MAMPEMCFVFRLTQCASIERTIRLHLAHCLNVRTIIAIFVCVTGGWKEAALNEVFTVSWEQKTIIGSIAATDVLVWFIKTGRTSRRSRPTIEIVRNEYQCRVGESVGEWAKVYYPQ